MRLSLIRFIICIYFEEVRAADLSPEYLVTWRHVCSFLYIVLVMLWTSCFSTDKKPILLSVFNSNWREIRHVYHHQSRDHEASHARQCQSSDASPRRQRREAASVQGWRRERFGLFRWDCHDNFVSVCASPVRLDADYTGNGRGFESWPTWVLLWGATIHRILILPQPNFLHAGDHVHLGPGVSSTRLTNPSVDLHDLPRIDLVLLSHYHA